MYHTCNNQLQGFCRQLSLAEWLIGFGVFSTQHTVKTFYLGEVISSSGLSRGLLFDSISKGLDWEEETRKEDATKLVQP